MAPISRLRSYSGPAIFSYGFRPFFLVGAIYAGLAVLIWLPVFFGEVRLPAAFSAADWHIHEMLYGYLPAVITGFLLTAIPNWTGRLPIQGSPLAVLATVWAAGRLAVLLSSLLGPLAAGAIDLMFLLLIAAAAAREVIAGRNWRNLPPVGILILLLGGNAAFHLEACEKGTAEVGTRLGIAAAIALVSLIGGRVIPSFTRNWLARENPGRLPVPFKPYDVGSLAVSTLALLLWVAGPDWSGTALAMFTAGAAHTIRLARWAGDRTFGDRLVLILHIGYAFVPIGFILLGAAILFPQDVPVGAGIHAWTVGAIGVMTLAIMTRASLGHTGHRLHAGPLTQAIYAAVLVASLARVYAAFRPDLAAILLPLAAARG